MKYSGLYFISNPGASLDASLNTVRSIVDGIESNMRTATQQAKWTLNHRLLRSTVPPPSKQNGDDARPPQPPSSQHQYSYQHLLTLSYLSQNRTYNYIHTPPLQNSQNPGASQDAPAGSSTGTDMAIPSQQADTHYDLLVTQWAQLWTPRRVLDLPNGITYTVSNFTIYVGELRAQRQGPQSSGVLSPGVVVCISTTAGDPVWDDESGVDDSTFPAANDDGFDYGDYDLSSARDMIREVWRIIREGKDFGKAEIRESFMDEKDFCAGKERAREAEVRMWCEALRQRGEAVASIRQLASRGDEALASTIATDPEGIYDSPSTIAADVENLQPSTSTIAARFEDIQRSPSYEVALDVRGAESPDSPATLSANSPEDTWYPPNYGDLAPDDGGAGGPDPRATLFAHPEGLPASSLTYNPPQPQGCYMCRLYRLECDGVPPFTPEHPCARCRTKRRKCRKYIQHKYQQRCCDCIRNGVDCDGKDPFTEPCSRCIALNLRC